MKIVQIALYEYFINNIPIETTIYNHKNIYDFCIRLKINHSSEAKYTYLENGQIKTINLNRTTRYFASNHGGSISVYYNGSNSVTRLNSDFQFKLFNKFYDDEYDIDYKFYIQEANKIKNSIVDTQLSLF